MDEFENLLQAEQKTVERFVRFRISPKSDADDVLQEVFLTAYQKFSQLKNKYAFKIWIISIARNKCNDYFRKRAKAMEIPLEETTETALSYSRFGITETSIVRETLSSLADKDNQILYLFFFRNLPQSEIAKKLHIPIGTVKSRLHTAKQNFKDKYPYRTDVSKGECNMKKLPEFMPEYKIEASTEAPFAVKWEELMGWFLVPKLGERLTWGMYEMPSRQITSSYDLSVTGNSMIHGVYGVAIDVKRNLFQSKPDRNLDMFFIAQLTDSHCRFLAERHYSKDLDAWLNFTFLDGDEMFDNVGSFMSNWGFGENNCGNETNLAVKGDIERTGTTVTSANKDFLLDIVGRYTVTIGGKSYDTVCVIDIETYNCGVVSEQFLDKNGRTILWRRFNRDDWDIEHYKKKWSEQLPENDRLIVNGVTYVHWYDCITDYIL